MVVGADDGAAALVHVDPLDVSTLPDVPGATACRADVPLPSSTLFAVRDAAPVPPFPTGNVPVTPVVKLTFVMVLLDALIVLFVSVCAVLVLATSVKVLLAKAIVLFISVCVEVVPTAVTPPTVAAAGKVAVPVTFKTFPDPILRPTEVPVPSPLNTASMVSKSVLSLVPHVS